jgi:hypothetical protein
MQQQSHNKIPLLNIGLSIAKEKKKKKNSKRLLPTRQAMLYQNSINRRKGFINTKENRDTMYACPRRSRI